MTTSAKLLDANEFWKAAKNIRQFSAPYYISGPSKSHIKGTSLVFLDGLMTNSKKKADVVKVTNGLNAAALFGWAVFANKTRVNQLLAMIFKRVTGESDEVCELAASLSALALEWPEFDEITAHPEVVHALASLDSAIYSKMYKQLEAARLL